MLKKSVAGGLKILWQRRTTPVKYVIKARGVSPPGQATFHTTVTPNQQRGLYSWSRRQTLPLLECQGFPLLCLFKRMNFTEEEEEEEEAPKSQIGREACHGLSPHRVLSQYSASRSVSICFSQRHIPRFSICRR